ncbi:MAG: FAD-dependent oxidoreductase [Halobacteriaceae archaeon]
MPSVRRGHMPTESVDVVVVGGGVAGRTAATYTARHGVETLVVDGDSSLLRRNAHLENVPGFPAGVNSRLFLDLLGEQAESAGAAFRDARAARVERADGGFVTETEGGERYASTYVVAATKNEVGYLDGLDVDTVERGKSFVDTDERGRTGVDGLYAAGRLAGKPHQVAVAAGHGAEVGVTLLEDSDEPFYHDWVAPEGYFTGRGRDVPPGCEEIDEDERQRRERASLDVMRERFSAPRTDEPQQHPSVEE